MNQPMNQEEKYNYYILVNRGKIVAAVCLERCRGDVLFQTHLPWIKSCSVLWRPPPVILSASNL